MEEGIMMMTIRSLVSSLVSRATKRKLDKDANPEGDPGQDRQTPCDDSKQYLETTIFECVAPEYKLREIVDRPDGVDCNEWLAFHSKSIFYGLCAGFTNLFSVISFFDHINMLYGTISEFCTMTGCPDMNGPGNRQYLWIDEKSKRMKLPAPQYIDYALTYTQKTVKDENIFPTKFGQYCCPPTLCNIIFVCRQGVS